MKPHLKTFLGDLSTLWIMSAVAVGVGFVGNVFRDAPLPLTYASKEERLRQAVERIAQNPLEGGQLKEITAESAERIGNDASPSVSPALSAVISVDLTTL